MNDRERLNFNRQLWNVYRNGQIPFAYRHKMMFLRTIREQTFSKEEFDVIHQQFSDYINVLLLLQHQQVVTSNMPSTYYFAGMILKQLGISKDISNYFFSRVASDDITEWDNLWKIMEQKRQELCLPSDFQQ
jgi:hypothetical protein